MLLSEQSRFKNLLVKLCRHISICMCTYMYVSVSYVVQMIRLQLRCVNLLIFPMSKLRSSNKTEFGCSLHLISYHGLFITWRHLTLWQINRNSHPEKKNVSFAKFLRIPWSYVPVVNPDINFLIPLNFQSYSNLTYHGCPVLSVQGSPKCQSFSFYLNILECAHMSVQTHTHSYLY